MSKERTKLEKSGKNGISMRKKELLLLAVIGIILLLAIAFVFGENKRTLNEAESLSDNEIKVCALLEQMQGVGDAHVMIYESADGVESVVIVCEGANDLQVIMNIREAVAAALGTQEKSVKIYLKKA